MSHYSFFTCALASISFLAGGLVQAGDYLISNEEDYNTSIADTLGIPSQQRLCHARHPDKLELQL